MRSCVAHQVSGHQWTQTVADKAADVQSHLQLGPIAGSPNIVTFEGLRAHGKSIRKEVRAQPTLGLGSRPLWNRRALSASTWMRSNKGPQLEWLYKIRKGESPLCPCGAIQSADHIVFACPRHHAARQALLGSGTLTWESLDAPRYHPDDEEQETDLVEEFFHYIFAFFS